MRELQKQRPQYISGNPNRTYKDKGWRQIFQIGLGADGISKNYDYRSFERRREHVRSLGLKNLNEWYQARKQTSFPKDIPQNPAIYYKDTRRVDKFGRLASAHLLSIPGEPEYTPHTKTRQSSPKV